MSKEYIDREEVIKILEQYDLSSGSTLGCHSGTIECAIFAIEMLPAADVASVRRGRWEAWMPDKNGETREFICTGCRFMVEMSWKQKECDYEWCPYCGCKMDKEEPNEL